MQQQVFVNLKTGVSGDEHAFDSSLSKAMLTTLD